MGRGGFIVPLLIGGATTSKIHTAVKIEPNYKHGATVYVADASRAVSVASSLLSKEQKPAFVEATRTEYARLAAAHNKGKAPERRLPIADARANALKLDWKTYTPPRPTWLGLKTFDAVDLAEIARYIDWTPFF